MSSTDAPLSTCLLIPPGEGDAYWTLGDLITFKMGPADTGGRFSVAENVARPGGGPPPHIHHREDETFYMLEGEAQFLYRDDVFIARAGDAFFLPRDHVHTFHNATDKPVKMLVMAAPCGFEKFMLSWARPKSESATAPPVRPEDIQKLLAVAPNFGIELRPDHKPANPPRPAQTLKRSLWVLGNRIDLKLAGDDTGGAFSLATIHVRPGGGSPAHIHEPQDELFYIESGRFELLLGDRTVIAEPGTVAFAPRGVVHSYKNVGDSPGHFAAIHLPGGFERFFFEIGVDCLDPSSTPPPIPDRETLLRITQKHGMKVVFPNS